MTEDGKQIKRMADVLRQGGAMLQDVCPECGSPLFKIKGDVWCINCHKRAIIAKGEAPTSNLTDKTELNNVEQTILEKIRESGQQIRMETDPLKLKELASLLSNWLDALERLKELQKQAS